MKIGCETGGTTSDGNAERPNVTSRVTEHLFVAPCDNKEVDACNHHEFVERPNVTSRVTEYLFVAPCDNKGVDACNHHKFAAPCDNFFASHHNTGTDTDALELFAPCDNLGSTYYGWVLFLPFLPRGVVVLCNNLVTPCDNEVKHGRGPTPDGGKGTAPEPHAR